MLSALGALLRRRPKLCGLLALLTLAGIVIGGYYRAVYQWDAAQAALKDRRVSDARRRLQWCLTVWPRSPAVHLLAARVERLEGNFQQAEAHLERCLKLQNGATEATQLEYLLLRVQAGEIDAVASELFNFVDHKHAESATILDTLFQAYVHNLRYGPAYACLNRWIEADPESPQPYFCRGWVSERLHAYEKAAEDYERALQLDPDMITARLRLAELMLREAKVPEAARHLERLHQRHPERPDVLARLGQCRFMQGRMSEARPLLEAALPKLPQDPELLIYLARLSLQDGRPAEAEPWLRRVLEADPFDVEAQFTLVSCLAQQGRSQDAAVALERYQKNKALLERANALLKDQASRTNLDPDAAAAIGADFLRIGQHRLGLYWLHQALERSPTHEPAHRALADYHDSKGDADKAARHRKYVAGAAKKTTP